MSYNRWSIQAVSQWPVSSTVAQCVNMLYSRWIHVVCGLYTPGIEYAEPNLLSGVTLDRLIASRWGAKECQLCLEMAQSKTGVVINCDAGMCKACFHVTW